MMRSLQAQPPLSLPHVDNSSELHPLLPSSVDPHPPLPPSTVVAVVGATAAVVIVVATAVVAVAAATATPQHRVLTRAGAPPLDWHHKHVVGAAQVIGPI
jgi:hypothetical protein